MRRILYLSLFVLTCAVPAFAQDPVKVDPNHYKVEFQNTSVRVLRITYGPHEKSVMHYHPNSVAVFQTDGRVKFTYPNGKSEEREFKAGQTMWAPAGRHNPENLGDSGFEVILVEMKARRRTTTKKPGTNTNTNTQ